MYRETIEGTNQVRLAILHTVFIAFPSQDTKLFATKLGSVFGRHRLSISRTLLVTSIVSLYISPLLDEAGLYRSSSILAGKQTSPSQSSSCLHQPPQDTETSSRIAAYLLIVIPC